MTSERIVAPVDRRRRRVVDDDRPDGDVPNLAMDRDDDRHVGRGEAMGRRRIGDGVDGAGVEEPIDEDRGCDHLAPLDPFHDLDTAGGEPEQLQR